jgi:uncharacterized protein
VTQLRQPQPPSTNGGDYQYWRDHTQIALQPVAAPSVLGLYGFAGATFIVAAQLAGWYGDSTTPQFLFPFAAVFGGIAQFLAGMWAYRARDALATAMHGMWGSFWIAYGILFLLIATGALTAPTPFVALGFWFIPLAAITFAGAVAASAENLGLVAVLGTLAAGSVLAAIWFTRATSGFDTAAGWVFVVSAALAYYVATAMLLESTFKRVVLPIGRRAGRERPGQPVRQLIQFEYGEPGIKIGQ